MYMIWRFIKNVYSNFYKKKNFINFFLIYNKKCKEMNIAPIKWSNKYPCMEDNLPNSEFDAHYLYHPAWAARIIYLLKPKTHIDISSVLYFSTMISTFVKTQYYEYRPAELNLSNLSTYHADLLKLPFENDSIESLSCMHVVEHIGLGRYGDEIDPIGDKKAIFELKRVIKRGGTLLFVVPVGVSKTMFNAHRIYSYDEILNYFSGFQLKEFSLVPDDHKQYGFIKNAESDLVRKQNYGCGCFWLEKL